MTTRYVITEDAYDLLDEVELSLNSAGYHTSRGIGSVAGLHADGTIKVIRVVEFTTETITRLEA